MKGHVSSLILLLIYAVDFTLGLGLRQDPANYNLTNFTMLKTSITTSRLPKLWKNRTMHVLIKDGFGYDDEDRIYKAIEEFNSKSVVQVLVVDSPPKDCVIISKGGPGSRSWSFVGRIGGHQTLNLEPSFRKADLMYQLLHAIGLTDHSGKYLYKEYLVIHHHSAEEGHTERIMIQSSPGMDFQQSIHEY